MRHEGTCPAAGWLRLAQLRDLPPDYGLHRGEQRPPSNPKDTAQREGWGHRMKVAVHKPGKRPRNQSAHTSVLDFWPHDAEGTFLLCRPPPGVLCHGRPGKPYRERLRPRGKPARTGGQNLCFKKTNSPWAQCPGGWATWHYAAYHLGGPGPQVSLPPLCYPSGLTGSEPLPLPGWAVPPCMGSYAHPTPGFTPQNSAASGNGC